jgi:diguanylate cyclase (GGDEF)-like protein
MAAERISAIVRSTDTVGRLGGDEFVVLAHTESRSGAADLEGRLRRAFEAPFVINGRSLLLGVSVGVAVAELDSASSADLLRLADVAMYTAKRSQI